MKLCVYVHVHTDICIDITYAHCCKRSIIDHVAMYPQMVFSYSLNNQSVDDYK